MKKLSVQEIKVGALMRAVFPVQKYLSISLKIFVVMFSRLTNKQLNSLGRACLILYKMLLH